MNEEQYQIYYKKYSKLLRELRIRELLGFDDSLMNDLTDNCVLFNQYEIEYKRTTLYYIVFFILGTIYSWIYGTIFFRHQKSVVNNMKRVFIQIPSKYNKFGRLAETLDNSIFCYFPLFDISLLKKLVTEHKKTNTPYVVLTFSIESLIKVHIFLFRHLYHIFKIGNYQIKNEELFNPSKNILVFILKYVAQRALLEPYVKNNCLDGVDFLMDYDKTTCTYVLKHCRMRNNYNYRIITINHGAFYGYDLAYIKPYSDVEFCTSLREVALIKKYSPETLCQIYDYGIQLLSYSETKAVEEAHNNEVVLVLGTATDGEWLQIQYDLICKLKALGVPFKYRARLGSADRDLNALSNVLHEEDCTHGTSLKEDCSRYSTIISFSLDALGVAAQLEKNIVVYVTREAYNDYQPIGEPSDQIILTSDIDRVISFTQLNISRPCVYSSITDRWVLCNIGELDYENVVRKIRTVLDSRE